MSEKMLLWGRYKLEWGEVWLEVDWSRGIIGLIEFCLISYLKSSKLSAELTALKDWCLFLTEDLV